MYLFGPFITSISFLYSNYRKEVSVKFQAFLEELLLDLVGQIRWDKQVVEEAVKPAVEGMCLNFLLLVLVELLQPAQVRVVERLAGESSARKLLFTLGHPPILTRKVIF